MPEVLLARRSSPKGDIAASHTRRAPSLVGIAEPLIVGIDNGGTNTRVRVSKGEEVLGEETYRTPNNYDGAMAKLSVTSTGILGRQRPDAVGASVAGKVSKDGTQLEIAGDLQAYGFVGRPLAKDIAQATRLRDLAKEIILNDCASGAASELATQPRIAGDGAYFTLSTGLGGAVYTREGWILPDEPGHRELKPGSKCGCGGAMCIEGHVGGGAIERKYGVRAENIQQGDPPWSQIKGDFHAGMELTFTTYRDAGLDVVRAGFTGSLTRGGPNMLGDLNDQLIRTLGRRAPRIVEAKHGDDSPLVGAERAAAALVISGTPPILIYEGIAAVKGLRF